MDAPQAGPAGGDSGCALKVFAEKGYASARMEDIAKRAGVTKGTIYLYLENKEAVFKSLVREAVATTLATVTADVSTFEGCARSSCAWF